MTAMTARPHDLVVSVFAMYGRRDVRAIAVSDLITLMSQLDVDAQAVRSVLSRARKRGTVRSVRDDGRAAYELNPGLEDIFEEGDARIFGQRRIRPEEPWMLVAYSVPESERHLRHQIRSVLIRRGFGAVGSAIWIAPLPAGTHARRELERAGLLQHVDMIQRVYLDEPESASKVEKWWDLPALSSLYREFLGQYQPVHNRWARATMIDNGAAFADYVPMVTRWRRLPFADPGLPEAYLPEDWPGLAAEKLFLDLHERLSGPARAYAMGVIG